MDFNKYYVYENGYLISKYTNKTLCNYNDEGYLRVRIGGKEYRGHRVIWEMHNGEIPEGYLIDHINGTKTDNRIENLRMCTRQQNNANSAPLSKYKGVTIIGHNKYRARITFKGKTFSLGVFSTPEEAAYAYNEKSLELNGEYAFCNRP